MDASRATGVPLESPVAKFVSESEQQALVAALAVEPGDLILIVADEWMTTCEVLGTLRNDLGRPPVYEGPYRYVWVVDFPMFVGMSEDGHPKPAHHPFTRPHPDDIDRLESDPMSVRSRAYDLVLNGWELGSGSIRIHEPELQQRIFDLLGIGAEEAAARFGFFLTPFRYGAPPHGGFAIGLDRLVAILAGEENIREVIAFPKTQSGVRPDDGITDARRSAAARDARPAPPAALVLRVGADAHARLRTPDERFENLPGWPYEPRYVEMPDGEGGTLRVHYVDEGPADAPPILCLHGEPSWAYLYRKMIAVLTAAGHRVVAPDLVGFGRSDKPTERDDYTYQRHVDWMTSWLKAVDLTGATLVCQDWGALIGLRLVAENPDRFDRIVVANGFLPTGDAPAGEAFLRVAGLLAEHARLPRRRHHQGRLPHRRSPTRSSRPTTRRSPTTPTRRARASSRCSCRSRRTTPRPVRTRPRGRCSRSGRSPR